MRNDALTRANIWPMSRLNSPHRTIHAGVLGLALKQQRSGDRSERWVFRVSSRAHASSKDEKKRPGLKPFRLSSHKRPANCP